MKIPLGYGYLLHQAKGAGDLGNLVSHGCVRVMRDDIYDLSEKIVAARETEISDAEIQKAKRTKSYRHRRNGFVHSGRNHIRHDGRRKRTTCTFTRTFTNGGKIIWKFCAKN